MDSLDFNLHQAILSSLASTWAAHPDDNRQGGSSPVFESFGISDDLVHHDARLSLAQVNALIALAEYVKDARDGAPIEQELQAVLVITARLHTISIERCLGAQGRGATWLISDQLAYALACGIISQSATPHGGQSASLHGLFDTYKVLKHQLDTANAPRIVEHVLPSIHGIYRAFMATRGFWTSSVLDAALPALSPTLSHDARGRLTDVLSGSFTHSSSESRHVMAVLARYSAHGVPMSVELVELCDSGILRGIVTVLASKSVALPDDSWTQLVSGSIQITDAALTANEAAKVLQIVENRIESNMANISASAEIAHDKYEVPILAHNIITASATCVASSLQQSHLSLLHTFLSDKAPIFAGNVQASALQSLHVLVHRYNELALPTIAHLRKFITSYTPNLQSGSDQPAPLLVLAAGTLASCVEITHEPNLPMSTTYSLLNLLPSVRSENGTSIRPSWASSTPPNGQLSPETMRSAQTMASRSAEDRQLVSCSILHTVAILACRFAKVSVTKMALSMLLQRVRLSDPSQEGVALLCIADMAIGVSKEDFTDAVKALADFTRSLPMNNTSGVQHTIFAAQAKLAGSLVGRPDFAAIYLRELLILYIDQTSPARSSAKLVLSDNAGLLSQLLDILSVIEILVSHSAFQPHHHPDIELVILFRNLWLTSVAIGLADPGKHSTAAHYAALKCIARKTPCLLFGTPLNYVDTELEFNPILRRDHGQSAEHLRAELSLYIPSQHSTQARALSYPQVVFLLTVARVECMRADLGDPSEIINYFHNEGVNASVLLGYLLDIAQKVTDAFVRAFGQRVRRHAVKRSSADHLKAMILQCSHSSSKSRKVAIQSLGTVFSVFPILLCDSSVIRTILESLTLLRDACESEYDDEYNPTYVYKSEIADISLTLSDDYAVRNEILTTFYQNSKVWLASALAASPLEMIGLLQDYLDIDQLGAPRDDSGMGKAVAMELAKTMPRTAREAGLPSYGDWAADTARAFASAFGTRHTYGSEAKTVIGLAREDGSIDTHHVAELKSKLRSTSEELRKRSGNVSPEELRPLLYRAAAVIIAKKELDYEILRELVFIPVHAINPPAMHLGVEVWAWLVDKRADVEAKLMVDLYLAWGWATRRRRGMFSVLLRVEDPINSKTEYSPTDIKAIRKAYKTVRGILRPYQALLEFLSSRFQAYRYRDKYLVLGCLRMVLRTLQRYRIWGTHPLCRELRMKFLTLGFSVMNSTHLEASLEKQYRGLLYSAALDWFEERPTWSYGSDRLQLLEDTRAVQRLASVVTQDVPHAAAHISSRQHAITSIMNSPRDIHREMQQLVLIHLESELQRLAVWINPLQDGRRGTDPASPTIRSMSESAWISAVQTAWSHSPRLAVLMCERFKREIVRDEVKKLVIADPANATKVSEALELFLAPGNSSVIRPQMKHLIHWKAVSPVQVLRLFLPAFNRDPFILQYAMRTLEQHPIDLVFFYVPQVVQALRTDPLNYMERFIFETSKISQLFCHQMIWTMKANCFKDDLAEVPDPDKEKFERMVDLIVSSLSGDAQAFYEKEFGFFNEVTSISRKLMPYVKKTKPEKKAKIDEEMAKIKVEKGVYLPSHPEGLVIDIDRHSGRPLQSHAKTPFMATFQVSREYDEDYSSEALEAAGGEHTVDGGRDGGANEGFPSLQGGEAGQPRKRKEETKIAAIFKVGDDCRQDVLALQVIAQFKNMFKVFGLDLQVQPYKVLATGPGTGIIDVVPDATSRDEMGRAKINDLTQFFLFQFGPAESVAFQQARTNFIQSMAAYSVLCYILQIKDRHNGNIMIDGEGRITHIDFGFLFDIGPGGIKFEPNSFKLTHEMITLMGGKTSQGYRQFCELTVKAFLAARPYVEDVVATCALMMATDLPSFKGEGTITRLRERFRPDLSEREAAKYMVGVIDNACENSMSIVYDQFQYFQNKIPYAS